MSSGGATPSPEPPFFKPDFRRWLRARRDGLDSSDRAVWSAAASRAVIDSGCLDRARLVATYAAFGSEAEPLDVEVWHRQRGGRLAYPAVTPQGLAWFIAERSSLRPTPPWSILEPVPGLHTPVPVEAIDGWLVPGLGFTDDGDRLGYGKGYYDRALSGARGPKIGFCFACQVVTRLPVDHFDQRVTALATEPRMEG